MPKQIIEIDVQEGYEVVVLHYRRILENEVIEVGVINDNR